MKRIAACITPHGYGHATRTIAILESLQKRYPALEITLFTTIPSSLFTQSLSNFTVHNIVGDVGIVQHNALKNDIPATIETLGTFFPEIDNRAKRMIPALEGCSLVLCDIAPLGIIAARYAGIPSVLVENFTWDWIYQPYCDMYPGIGKHIETISNIYSRADYHIQVEPVCDPLSRESDTFPPVFRKKRATTDEIRNHLGAADRSLIVISMGGIDYTLPLLADQVRNHPDLHFVVTGQQQTGFISDNCLTLARTTEIYHPDLMTAADLVVCKSGYSTVAECYQGGARILMVTRPDFRESEVIADFVRQRRQGECINETVLQTGAWLTRIKSILESERQPPARTNGADLIADYLISLPSKTV